MQKTTEVFFDASLHCGYAYTADGNRFLFDMEDADLVSSRGWHITRRGYVGGKLHRRERPLHKIMLCVDSKHDVDHINRNKMDNRRCNLRVCTHHENSCNQKKRNTNTSGYMGVSFAKNIRKYESYVHYDGRKHGLGYFYSPQEAALVRDAAALYFFGEFCNLNFSEGEAVWLTG